MNVLDRMVAAQAFADEWTGRAFEWGVTDCACAPVAVRHYAGLSSPINLAGRYKTPVGAVRAIKKLGHSGLVDAIGSFLTPIAPASALPCDVLGYPSDEPFDVSLSIKLNGVRALAIHPETLTWEHAGIDFATHAWRIA